MEHKKKRGSSISSDMENENNPPDTQACYETVASQEEIYLETTEEELRADLTCEPTIAETLRTNRETLELDWELEKFDDQCECTPPQDGGMEQQLNEAAEELITGDSDDPPLSESTVTEMLRVASEDRKLGST